MLIYTDLYSNELTLSFDRRKLIVVIMHLSKVISLGLFVALSYGAPASHIRHEKRDRQHDARWIKGERAPAKSTMPVRIAINQRNLDYGHDMLIDISDPTSPNFAKHMTSQEVAEFFSPAQESIDAIGEWLTAAGIGADRYAVSPGRQWIKFDASVEELEKLVHAQYHTFTHKETSQEHVACDEYHVPHAVHPHIDFITPTVGMDAVLKKRVSRRSKSVGSLPPVHSGPSHIVGSLYSNTSADTCYKGLTPACIKGSHPWLNYQLYLTNQSGLRYSEYYQCSNRQRAWYL